MGTETKSKPWGVADMSDDITFSCGIQDTLKLSGFNTDSISSDEDGYSHCIRFDNGDCAGKIHTEDGKIVFIEAK